MTILEEMSSLLQKGRAAQVKELVEQALEEGISPQKILNEGMLSGMNIIGEKFKKNEVFVPEVLVAARAMNKGMEALQPVLTAEGVEPVGVAVIGTVKGDLHDIGKNLVRMMMEGKGIEVIDIGVDVPAEKFIETAIQHDADLICCSALLTTTMGEMKTVVNAVAESQLAGKVKVMVGGAPVTQSFAEQIGADAYTPDATTAAEVAYEYCVGERE